MEHSLCHLALQKIELKTEFKIRYQNSHVNSSWNSKHFLLRSGGPALKRTQVYPTLYGKRICNFHEKFEDWLQSISTYTNQISLLDLLWLVRNLKAWSCMRLWKLPTKKSPQKRSRQLGAKNSQKRNFLATSRGVALCPCGVTEVRRPGAWIKADLRAMRYFLAHPEVWKARQIWILKSGFGL